MFDGLVSKGDFYSSNAIPEIINKNLVPYFLRKGLSIPEAVSRSHVVMSFLITNYGSAINQKDYKTIIIKLKDFRKSFAVSNSPHAEGSPLPPKSRSSRLRKIKKGSESIHFPWMQFQEKLLDDKSEADIPLFSSGRLFGVITQNAIDYSYSVDEKIEISDAEFLPLIADMMNQVDRNLEASDKSLRSIDKKLGDVNGSHARDSRHLSKNNGP